MTSVSLLVINYRSSALAADAIATARAPSRAPPLPGTCRVLVARSNDAGARAVGRGHGNPRERVRRRRRIRRTLPALLRRERFSAASERRRRLRSGGGMPPPLQPERG